MRAAVLPAFLMVLSSCASGPTRLCQDRILVHQADLRLNRNERVLVCGTSDGPEGWREVPIPQAQYQLKVLLQNDGYLHPRFERHGDKLEVWAGPLDKTQVLEIRGADGLLDAAKKREVVGHPMSPEKLDEVKRWAETVLRSRGYACPDVKMHAQAWDGRITADVAAGRRQRVKGIDYRGLEDLDREAIARYQAFEPGDWYDVRDTQLTAARMLNDGLFQSAHFTATCRETEVDLKLGTSLGKPRILRFGVGATTEEFPFARIWFKDARLDRRASSFTATLFASPRKQSLDVNSEFYRMPFSRRSFLGPRLYFAREHERSYEVVRAKMGADIGRLWDAWWTRWAYRLGPSFNYVDTVQGIGPTHLGYVSWEGELSGTSHNYELYTRDQYEGSQGRVSYSGQRKGVGSKINVDRFELNFKNLWNLGGYAPPIFVLGSRVQAIGVATKQIGELTDSYRAARAAVGREKNLLPADYRVFFGGDQNLRGFSRQVLGNSGIGYTTALYAGFELRLIEQLPYRFEPFLLYDAARLGVRHFTVEPPIFTSAGLGLRWPSPFGTLRGSAARGRILNEDQNTQGYPQEWVYFLSFGQEF